MSKPVPVAIKLTLILAIPLLTSLGLFLFLKSIFLNPMSQSAEQSVSVEIYPGMNFGEIASILEEKELCRQAWALRLLARMKKIDTKISSGEYSLSARMTPTELIEKLVSGDTVKRRILIKPGANIWDAAKAIDASGLMKEEEFLKAVTDEALLRKWGIPGDSFEGYLYPETYFFSKPLTAEQVIAQMVREADSHWAEQYNLQATLMGMSRHDIVILASIIEKESGLESELPLVSSVLHNRLNKKMRLQTDPTVIYGIPNFNGNLTKADLSTPSPYNTYTNFGLPKGPIANPSEASIRAALYPIPTTYLFFVADGSGKHTFSTTLKEHNSAVRKFLRITKNEDSEESETP